MSEHTHDYYTPNTVCRCGLRVGDLVARADRLLAALRKIRGLASKSVAMVDTILKIEAIVATAIAEADGKK